MVAISYTVANLRFTVQAFERIIQMQFKRKVSKKSRVGQQQPRWGYLPFGQFAGTHFPYCACLK